MPDRTCSVDSCIKPVKSRGWCSMHNARFDRHGDLHFTAYDGSGYIRDNGYRVVRAPGHPVAWTNGQAYQHRVILFNKIGPGPHQCHHCDATVRWMDDRTDPDYLTADHLDRDKNNNQPANLVPACNSCNSGWAGHR